MKIMDFMKTAMGISLSRSRSHALTGHIRADREAMAGAIILGGLIFLGGCATQAVQVNGEVSVATQAAIRKVAVVSDYSMEHSEEADQLADSVRAALRDQGFTVVSSQDQADLIILPFFALLQGNQGFTPHVSLRSPQSPLFNQDMNAAGATMMAANAGRLGLSLLDSQTDNVPRDNRVGLMVTAITRETWSSLSPDNQKVPRVWRVTATATSPPGQEQAYPSVLVKAAAPYFSKNTAGVITKNVKIPH